VSRCGQRTIAESLVAIPQNREWSSMSATGH